MAGFLTKPKYYDAPEGKEPIDKIVALSKPTFLGALVTGIADCVWITETKTPLQSANCLAFWLVPALGMSATFASVTYVATNIRGKDDHLNYAIGALACSPILHAWRKRTSFTLWVTASLVAVALFAKEKQIKGWKFLPEHTKRINMSYDSDWTFLNDVDKSFRSPYK